VRFSNPEPTKEKQAVLQQVSRLQNCRILGKDGEIGRVEDVYFDDSRWVIRHLVVDTAGWMGGREVLVSPYAVRFVDPDARAVIVTLTRESIRRSPPVDCERPVSRQQEIEQYRYYGYPEYWPYPTFWAGGRTPVLSDPPDDTLPEPEECKALAASEGSAHSEDDVHLRSSSEVTGYRIHTADGYLGHLEDLLFDEQSWAIECLVVDTRNWLPGRKVLLSPEAIQSVNWTEGEVVVTRTKDELKAAPEFVAAHLRAGHYDRIAERSGHAR
jgi:sporulation protein YlmC with PRC-barrel domain